MLCNSAVAAGARPVRLCGIGLLGGTMKGVIARQLLSILLCTALPLAAACGVAEQLPDDLMGVIDSFYAAIENDDIEARVALLDDELVMMPNHWTMTTGKEAVAAGFRAAAVGGRSHLRAEAL